MRVRFVVALVLAGMVGVVTLADRPSAAPAVAAVGPTFESIGPLAFGPDGVLFAADPQAAAIFALDLGAAAGSPARRPSPTSTRRSPRCSAPTPHRSRSPTWWSTRRAATPTSR